MWLDAIAKYQQRRHQRPPAHASQPDHQAHKKPRKNKSNFVHAGDFMGKSIELKLLCYLNDISINEYKEADSGKS